jgi:hypothetical protein
MVEKRILSQQYMKEYVLLWIWTSLTGLLWIIEFGVGFLLAFGFMIRRTHPINPPKADKFVGLNIRGLVG